MPVISTATNNGVTAQAVQPTTAFAEAAHGTDHRARQINAAARSDIDHATGHHGGHLLHKISEKVHEVAADHHESKASRQLAADTMVAQNAALSAATAPRATRTTTTTTVTRQ